MLKRPELALKAYSPSPRDSSCFDRDGESKAIDQPSFGISTLTGTARARPVTASTTARTTAALMSVRVFMVSLEAPADETVDTVLRLGSQRYLCAERSGGGQAIRTSPDVPPVDDEARPVGGRAIAVQGRLREIFPNRVDLRDPDPPVVSDRHSPQVGAHPLGVFDPAGRRA